MTLFLALVAAFAVVHAVFGFVLGRTGALRACVIEAAALFAVGLYATLGGAATPGHAASAQDALGVFGIVGALIPVIAGAYAAGVGLRTPLRLPRAGLVWRVTRTS